MKLDYEREQDQQALEEVRAVDSGHFCYQQNADGDLVLGAKWVDQPGISALRERLSAAFDALPKEQRVFAKRLDASLSAELHPPKRNYVPDERPPHTGVSSLHTQRAKVLDAPAYYNETCLRLIKQLGYIPALRCGVRGDGSPCDMTAREYAEYTGAYEYDGEEYDDE